jgi:periplasmic divalent cation tolerance protein
MPEEPAAVALVVTTLENEEQARAMAHRLVEERLIACGNVVPALTSIYRWEGRVEQASEVLLIMKTRGALLARLFERVGEIHPYEVPELVALRPDDVADAYARWVLHETTEVTG